MDPREALPGTCWRDTASGRNALLVATELMEGTREVRFLVQMKVEGMTKPLWARDYDLGRRFTPVGDTRWKRIMRDDAVGD